MVVPRFPKSVFPIEKSHQQQGDIQPADMEGLTPIWKSLYAVCAIIVQPRDFRKLCAPSRLSKIRDTHDLAKTQSDQLLALTNTKSDELLGF